ncbi:MULTISPECIES: ABC transporter substrate-binding protein [Actinoalloteichus]|uniref:ABC-type dipeptide transport system, periplasmic component n=1 Tax=Actinoalloteichus fjordicus TaxID=1612552 RepID=A0AAC9PTV5_9PSEU|nr:MULTISPECIES: ABC transporter substrate-binding protein [Actinoalloteichus]APU16447.1 ABC-type dipeptide transport system, periplasmic component [Actinoalloteichus fjordicus]APU22506.1 ABC-type dipeptide transport system, periplasmic component [Actinoalloteichus sp. GBA129-24]
MTERTTVSRRALLKFGGGATAAVALFGISACTGDEAPNPFGDTAGGDPDALESPLLAERVAAGELPPLTERLPVNPLVVEPWESTGRFGGTIRRAQTDALDNGILQAFAGVGLLEWNKAADASQPSLAETFEKSDDNRVYTFVLREGLRWSDGEPFTSADVLFTVDRFLKNDVFWPGPPFWFSDAGQQRPEVETPDERTVVITFERPFALFEKFLCHPAVSYQFIKPRHYLEQFHPDVTDRAVVDEAASAAGFDSWDQYFADRDNWWTNPERPVMGAFMVTSSASGGSGTAELERNPYYYKTDPDGRQLPYVDHVQVQVLEQDALDLRAANGDLDMQGHFLGYNTTQVYVQNAESRGFEVLRWQATASLLSICPNLSHQDPVLREVLADVRVRAALSHAIDREEMNTTLLGGLGVARHPLATEDSDYYVEGGGQRFLDYDVAEAERLLDEAGLADRNGAGTRLLPDGRPFELVLLYVANDSGVPQTDAFEMVRRNWAEIGVSIVVRPVDGTLYTELRASNDFDLDGTTMPENDWDLEPVWFIPTASNSHTAPGYGQWYSSGGTEGIEPTDEIKQLMDEWDALRTAENDEARIESGRAIMRQHDENVYAIGLLKLPFQPIVVNNGLRNVRDDDPALSFYYGREGISKPEQMYFSEPTS